MNGLVEDLDSFVEDIEFGEAFRPPVRTPSRQSSFASRPTGQAASQGQVQSAARNLDSKIETLSAAVRALETRVNGVAADQQRVTSVVRKEVDERKKANDAIRGDLQQTKLLGALLPMISQQSKDVQTFNAEGQPAETIKVLTPSSNPIASMLPIFLLLGTGSGGEGSKGGGLGDGILPLLLVVSLFNRP